MPYDFDILRPSVPGMRLASVSSVFGSGKTGAVEVVEAAHDLARQLDVRRLVLAHRHGVGLVDDDVGRLQQRVAQEAVGREVLLGELLLLLLVGRHALEPRHGHDHREQQVQLGVLGHQALDEEGRARGIEPGGQPVGRDLEDVLADPEPGRRSRW